MRPKNYLQLFTVIVTGILIFLTSEKVFSEPPLPQPASQYPDCLRCHLHKSKAAKKYVHPVYKKGCYSCHTEAHRKGAKFPRFLFAEGVDVCWGCHDKAMFSKKFGHPPVSRGECDSCHDVHTSDNQKLLLSPMPELCFTCHDKAKFVNKANHPPVAQGQCTSCHDVHSSDSKKLLLSDPPGLCFMCHDKEKYVSEAKRKHHAPVVRGQCASCHDPHASAGQKLLLAPTPDVCYFCHEAKEFKDKYTHSPVAEGMCMSCHEPHQSYAKKLLIVQSPDLCFNCHDKALISKEVKHPPVASGMCTVCHDLHATPYPSQLLMPITDGCLQCHPRIAESPHAAGGYSFTQAGHPLKGKKDPSAKSGELSCASCHDPHSSDYMDLFKFPAQKAFDLCGNCHKSGKK